MLRSPIYSGSRRYRNRRTHFVIVFPINQWCPLLEVVAVPLGFRELAGSMQELLALENLADPGAGQRKTDRNGKRAAHISVRLLLSLNCSTLELIISSNCQLVPRVLVSVTRASYSCLHCTDPATSLFFSFWRSIHQLYGL